MGTVGRVEETGCVARERIKTGGRVVGAACVATERINAAGRVGVASGVAKERINAVGRVEDAGGVAKECFKPVGRVALAGCVAKERIKTDGRVIGAACEVVERTVTLSGAVAGIASVRCWGWQLRSTRWRKRKPGHGDGEWDEKETASSSRGTNRISCRQSGSFEIDRLIHSVGPFFFLPDG
jgi:hypothetical protein